MTPMERLHAAAALDGLARALHHFHQAYLDEPVQEWMAIPYHRRSIYVELSARTLRMMSAPSHGTTEDALFHLANALGRADMVTGLRETHGKVIGQILPHGAA